VLVEKVGKVTKLTASKTALSKQAKLAAKRRRRSTS
jgi:hypothetical protein